jgi:adenylate cyclase
MSDHESLKQLVQNLSFGIAIVNPDSWLIEFENAKFFQWFPPVDENADKGDSLSLRIPEINLERAQQRLEAKRPYRFDCETEIGARKIPLTIEIRPVNQDEDGPVCVECRDISKQKETEYMLESYSDLSEQNIRELQKEKDRVEKLLLNIMPKSIYEEMRDFGTTTPQKFDSASVMMLDFVGFTDMAISRDPTALIAELNDIFSTFDRIVDLFNCERIKTIGDAYMAVSGMPETAPGHASNIAKVALRMKRYLEKRNAAHTEKWLCRIGINTGPVIGSIVGIQKYVYDIFGPGVNLAARLEALSDPMQITLCEDTYDLIRDDFLCSELGEVEIKGFGVKKLYSLESELKVRR